MTILRGIILTWIAGASLALVMLTWGVSPSPRWDPEIQQENAERLDNLEDAITKMHHRMDKVEIQLEEQRSSK